MRLPNGFGSVVKLPGRRRKPYLARKTIGWTEDGKQIRKSIGTYPSRKAAIQALVEYNDNPIDIDEAYNKTLGQIYEDYAERAYKELQRGTINNYKAAWKRLKVLADTPMRHLRTSNFQKIIDEMIDEGLSRSALEKAKTLCGILCDRAMADGIITINYGKQIRLPKARKAKRATFTMQEVELIYQRAESGDIWAGTVMIMLYTGMRVGELLTILRDHVDVQNWVFVGGIKTDAGKDRPVPIHSKIKPYVQYWYDSSTEAGGKYLIHRNGEPISVGYYRTKFYYPALRHAGVERHLTPHSTRHTFASMLDRAEAREAHIAELMGHADFAVTRDVYTHPHIEALRETIERLP